MGNASAFGVKVDAVLLGNSAQRVFVVPDLDLTVVFTAGAYGDPRSAPFVNALVKNIVALIEQ